MRDDADPRVIGATGTVGSRMVDELLGRGCRCGYSSGTGRGRPPFSTAGPASRRRRHRPGIDPRRALDGVERVCLCTPNHLQQVENETKVIDAAFGAGIRRLVKIGANGAQIGSPLALWDAHGHNAHLRRSDVPACGCQQL